ncbi:uncharacterized protein [Anabrus simplex]|uniref:uncharacterized protein n=1 Tax=Anabrus simplex TaxID=316456 RepID=UPI0035A2F31B
MRLLSCCVLLVAVVSPAFGLAEICSRCKCYPRDKPITVFCYCNEDFQRLTLSPGHLREIPTVKKFSISFCQSAEFLKNSFAEAHDLVALNIEQVENVTIQMGVFSALQLLSVDNVANLRLEKRAFMGVDEMRNLIIRGTHMTEIPEHALYDIKNLYSAELSDVIIDNVRSNAVRLQMDEGYPMIIDNCTINNIEENGLVLMPARDFRLSKTNLLAVAKNGINITSQGSIVVSENYIGANMSEDAVHITGLAINMTGNTIEHVPRNFLSNIHGPLSFTKNTLLQADIDISDMGSLFMANSTGNRLPCLCSQKSTMSYLSLAEPMTSSLERNFCIAPCTVSLLHYPERCSSAVSVEDDIMGTHLCEPETTTTTTTTITTTPTIVSTRRTGRDLYPHSSTTHSPLVTPASRLSGAIQMSGYISLILTMVAALLLR